MRVTLGDVCEKGASNIKQSDIANMTGEYPIYGAAGYIGNVDFYHQEKPYVAIVKDGAGIGRTTLHPAKSSVIGTMQYLLPKDNVLPEYLCYVVRHMHLEKYFTGATIPHIYFRDYKNEKFNLDSLDKQAEIIEILGKAESIILKRRKELAELDNLIKARFVEMFGIYPANQMGWETGKIRDTVADVRYGSSRPAVDGGKYPYLRMNNITYGGELDLSDVKRIDVPENELDKCTVRRGDVLFNRTNSKELVGKTCVYDRDEMMVLAGFVIRVRVNDRVLPEFLSAFLNTDFSKKTLSEMCKAAIGQANINAQEMQNIGLYLPPLELQRQFVQFKKQIDKSKVVESIHRMNVLFNITLNGGNRYDIRANEF
ncbi:restriction endonuclease subunit S [Subdoligranulum variabile]|uniref:restriction endonuclease subunit S n=1 Tax=Subdoligranulum variabile TaxID=214851 RepID=UPI0026EF47DC|nr:restriction endonuclease subunit S [Subdoligranulum variabile]